MITKEQAIALGEHRLIADIHCETGSPCSVVAGPRGRVKVNIEIVRVSGKCRTWVRSPGAFRLPVKYGLRTSMAITDHNAHMFHLAEDCPERGK